MTFGERLKQLRLDAKLTQIELGNMLCLSGRMIGFYEQGTSYPQDPQVIIRLAHIFNVTLDYLFGVSNIKTYKEIDGVVAQYEQMSERERDNLRHYLAFLKQEKHK